jgi:hypothetical protein
MGDTDGEVFASSSHNPARGSIALAKKVQVEPALADPKLTDLKKGEELWKPRIHDPELSAGRVRVSAPAAPLESRWGHRRPDLRRARDGIVHRYIAMRLRSPS